MTLPETLSGVRYVTDASGGKTDVLVPLQTWHALLTSWKQLIELLEDHEDGATVQEWLAMPASERVTISLEALEQELAADGLLPR